MLSPDIVPKEAMPVEEGVSRSMTVPLPVPGIFDSL